MEGPRRSVEMLRADATLASPTEISPGVWGMLFPEHAPQVNGDDYRVYEAYVELPENSAIREALPRILVETLPNPVNTEQGGYHEGPVSFLIHTITPKEESQLCDEIAARVATVIASTRFSNARIVASELVPEGESRKGRITAFNNAWERVDRYTSANVGVIAA